MNYHEFIKQFIKQFSNEGNDELKKMVPKHERQKFYEWISKPPKLTTLRVSTHLLTGDEALSIAKPLISKYCHDRKWLDLKSQLLFDDILLVEMTGPHPLDLHRKQVIVDCIAASAIMRGADLFKAGILSTSADLLEEDRVSIMADIDGKCRRGALQYDGRLVHVGNGISNVSRHEIFSHDNQSLQGIGIIVDDPLFRTISDDLLPKELFYMQNLSSTLVNHVLDPCANDSILDMCASPGGKLSHALTRIKGIGELVACDKSEKKCERIRTLLQRFQFDSKSVNILAMDARDLHSQYPENYFDKIILDPPCSGIGQRPKLSLKQCVPQDLSKVQKRLMETAVKLLKPGGRLVYSTCTVNPDENEGIVSWTLETFGESLEQLDVPSILNWPRYNDDPVCKHLKFDYNSIAFETDGWNLNDSIGFFLVAFTKKCI